MIGNRLRTYSCIDHERRCYVARNGGLQRMRMQSLSLRPISPVTLEFKGGSRGENKPAPWAG